MHPVARHPVIGAHVLHVDRFLNLTEEARPPPEHFGGPTVCADEKRPKLGNARVPEALHLLELLIWHGFVSEFRVVPPVAQRRLV